MDDSVPFTLALPPEVQAEDEARFGTDVHTARELRGVAAVRDGAFLLQFREVTRTRRRRWVFNELNGGRKAIVVDDSTSASAARTVAVSCDAIRDVVVRAAWWHRTPTLTVRLDDLRAADALGVPAGAELRFVVSRANRDAARALHAELALVVADARLAALSDPRPGPVSTSGAFPTSTSS